MISCDSLSIDISYIPFDTLQKHIAAITIEEDFEAGDITLIFCSDEELLEINTKYLNHDLYTDIITFDYSYDRIISGDLFVSIDRVKENAISYQISFLEELHRVVYHGVLHLMGYNDKEDQEIVEIRSKEQEYLNKLFHVKHT